MVIALSLPQNKLGLIPYLWDRGSGYFAQNLKLSSTIWRVLQLLHVHQQQELRGGKEALR